ncbi:hypothetical protein LINPERPRIM_LOCUS3080, partial [Linum perenne]
IVCAISLSLTLKSRYSSQPSAYFHRRLFTIKPQRSVPLLRPATSSSLTYSSVLFFMDTSTGGDGSSNNNSSSTASTKGVGVKQKTDIAWNYFEELVEENGSKVFRCLFSTGSDSEDVADIGDEVAQAENHMDTGPSGVGRDDQDTRYLFDDTSLF